MKHFFTFVTALFCVTIASAQWTANTLENTMLSVGDSTFSYGEFKYGGDGYYSLYYAYMNTPETPYKLYLQKYSFDGVPQWTDKGIVIDNGPTKQWVPGVDLTFDETSVYVAFSKTVVQPNDDTLTHLFVNRVTFNGEKLWGEEGIDLSDGSTDANYGPVLMMSNENNLLIGYDIVFTNSRIESNMGNVGMKMITHNGIQLWSYVPPLEDSVLNWGVIFNKLENNEIMAMFRHDVIQKDTALGADKHNQNLLVQKFNSEGIPQFETNKNVFTFPEYDEVPLSPVETQNDKNNGIYITTYHYGDPNDCIQMYSQYVNSNGEAVFAEPLGLSTLQESDIARSNFGTVYLESADQLIVTFVEMNYNPGSNSCKIIGQSINNNGDLLWGDEGKELAQEVSLSDYVYGFSKLRKAGTSEAMHFYMKAVAEDSTVKIYSNKIGADGTYTWDDDIIISNRPDGKKYIDVTQPFNEQYIVTWPIDFQSQALRQNSMLFGQNIFADGHMGTSVFENREDDLDVTIYPNPSNGDFIIKLDDVGINSVNVQLINISGQILKDNSYNMSGSNNFVDFSAGNIPRGMYILKIRSEKSGSNKAVYIY